MAWGIKYKAVFLQHDGLHKEVRLLVDGFVGAPVEWCCGPGTVEYDRGGRDQLFPTNILLTTKVHISIVFEEVYDLSDIIHSRKAVKVEVYDLTNEVAEFTGWLEPWNASHPYHSPVFEVSMVATCGLGRLKSIPYPMTVGMSTIVPALNIVQKCLAVLGNGIDTHVCIHTFASGGTLTLEALKSFSINETRYYNGSEPMKCDQVLHDVLVRFSPEVYQEDNAWKIFSIPDISKGYNGYRVYGEGSTDLIANYANSDRTFEINGEDLLDTDGSTLGVGEISVESPINKWIAEANLAPKSQIIFNGDLRLYDGNTFVGWTMNMPSGNPGWEKFDTTEELYPYGIKLTGNDIFLTKRKKGWASLGLFYGRLLATPPYNYIETPVSKFNPAEKSIVVEFDYATSINYPKGFVAIRLMNDDETEQVWINSEGEIHNKNKGDFWMIDFDQKIAHTGGRNGAVPDLGKFSLEIPLFNEVDRRSGHVSIWNKIAIRFYATGETPLWDGRSGPGGQPGILWIYGVRVLIGEAGGRSVSGEYRYELSKNAEEGDEGEKIPMMTGDYSLWWSGTTFLNDGVTPTSKWNRVDHPGEDVSIYRAMLLDRLAFTWRTALCLEGDVRMMRDRRLKYSDILVVPDLEDRRFKIVRYRENAETGIASIRALHIQYEEPTDPLTETFVGGVRQMAQDGRRDGVYPKENNPNSRNTTEIPPAEDEPIESPLFLEIPPVLFVVGTQNDRHVDLIAYLTEEFEDIIDDLEFQPSFKVSSKPVWVSADASDWEVDLSGKPTQVGEYTVSIQLLTTEGMEMAAVDIPVVVVPASKITYSLTPGGVLSTIQPKQLPFSATERLAAIEVEGGHDAHIIQLKGSGLDLNTGLIEHDYAETATYTPFSAVSLNEGIFDLSYIHYRKVGIDKDGAPIYTETHRSRATFIHGENLGDEDPDRKAVLTLTSGGAEVAEITGSETILEYLQAFNIRVDPMGLVFDRIVLTLAPEVEPYIGELIPTRSDITGSTSGDQLFPDGTIEPDPDYQTTGLIAVSEGDRLWVFGEDTLLVTYAAGTAVASYTTPEVLIPAGVTHIRACSHQQALRVERVEFNDSTLFDSDTEKPAGRYSIFLKAYQDDQVTYEKYGRFQIREKAPEPLAPQAGLKLVTKPGGSYQILGEMPETGGVYPLPADGFDVLHEVLDIEVDRITWEVFHLVAGGWTQVNTQLFTGYPQERIYGDPVQDASVTAFWNKTSKDIGTIHAAGRFKFVFTDWLNGQKVNVSEADFLLRPDVPVGPASGLDLAYADLPAQALVIQQANIPETGGYYPILKEDEANGFRWVINGGTLDGETLFDQVVIKLNGTQVADWHGDIPRPNMTGMFSEYLNWGTIVDNSRYVGGENIDQPGIYQVIYDYYHAGLLVGTKTATIERYDYDPDPSIKDPSDCCTGGGGLFYTVDEWI